ncbi:MULTISPECIES: GNAT family N-acetyltransferase [Bradyrhizobium]|uniref:GNAT family N-acetyltransferase n=1 Tax=Bradyrhizobium TaxID=374 RepID=UPI0009EC4E6F|nr:MULTISPECIES: GNAT family N-acetyltransferase [Bradyrhizobium]WOH52229.1 GNAT family N-acetyltransferase [Bradyrhizobium sp. sBnM-33]
MVTTREVSVDDVTTVTHMVAALLAELEGGQVQAGLDTQLAVDLLIKERVYGFLAFAEARPVGIIMLSESAALFARGTYGIITELYVVPDQRSSGIAMRLIEAAVSLGTVKGWGQLELGAPRQPTWSRNRSLAFYLKAGFAEIGPRLKLPLHGLGQSIFAERWPVSQGVRTGRLASGPFLERRDSSNRLLKKSLAGRRLA